MIGLKILGGRRRGYVLVGRRRTLTCWVGGDTRVLRIRRGVLFRGLVLLYWVEV